MSDKPELKIHYVVTGSCHDIIDITLMPCAINPLIIRNPCNFIVYRGTISDLIAKKLPEVDV